MKYDIVILGGGVVGLTQALALSRGPWQIALIEPGSLQLPLQPGLRVSALNRSSQQLLQQLSVWPHLTQASPYRGMELFEAEGDCCLSFEAQALAEPDLGHIVDNQQLRSALLTELQASSVTLLDQCRPSRFHAADSSLWLESGQVIQSRLFIGAEGVDSWLRQQAALGLDFSDYRQMALVAQIRSQQAHQKRARQRFLPAGPLALLPLFAAQQLSIVWSLPPERAKALQQMPVADFEQQLNQVGGDLLGHLQLDSERICFPLAARQAQAYVAPGVALVGDAAHSIHPMAGLGLNLGLEDVRCLTQVLLAAAERGRSVAELAVLMSYQRQRRSANAQAIALMAACKALFGLEPAAWSWLRKQGMRALNRSALKHRLARWALYGSQV